MSHIIGGEIHNVMSRSAAQFGEAIENSVRMTGVLNTDNKPNCLIIDEIDGAGAPAIQVLCIFCRSFQIFEYFDQFAEK